MKQGAEEIRAGRSEDASVEKLSFNPYSELTEYEKRRLASRDFRVQVWCTQDDFTTIAQRGRWFRSVGEDEEFNRDPKIDARMRELQVSINEFGGAYNLRNIDVGQLCGLLENYSPLYTDSEISEICTGLKYKLSPRAIQYSLCILHGEAAAGKNLGGEFLAQIYNRDSYYADDENLLRIFLKIGLDEKRANAWLQNIGESDGKSRELEYLDNDLANSVELHNWGIADFVTECCIGSICPREIGRLLQIEKRIPTTNTVKFEQSRVDAMALCNCGLLGSYRFIHDQASGANALLSAMVSYYDAGGTEHESEELSKLKRTLSELNDGRDSVYYLDIDKHGKIYDLKTYNLLCSARDYQNTNRPHVVQGEPAIDVLRRLEQNTRLANESLPAVQNAKLGELLKAAEIRRRPDGSETVSMEDASALARHLNQWLMMRHGESGLMPSEMHAIIYARRAATVAVDGMSMKDWREAFYDDGFKNIVLFRDLTESYDDYLPVVATPPRGYNHLVSRGFEEFWGSISKLPINPSDEEIAEHYSLLCAHIWAQEEKLLNYYSEFELGGSRDELWSKRDLNYSLMRMYLSPREWKLRSSVHELFSES